MLCLKEPHLVPILTDVVTESDPISAPSLQFDFLFEESSEASVTSSMPMEDVLDLELELELEFDFSLDLTAEAPDYDHEATETYRNSEERRLTQPTEDTDNHAAPLSMEQDLNPIPQEEKFVWSGHQWGDFDTAPSPHATPTTTLEDDSEPTSYHSAPEETQTPLLGMEVLHDWLALILQDGSLRTFQKSILEHIHIQLAEFHPQDAMQLSHAIQAMLPPVWLQLDDKLLTDSWEAPKQRSEALLYQAYQLCHHIKTHSNDVNQSHYLNTLASVFKQLHTSPDLQ